jgi:hypothetical protein
MCATSHLDGLRAAPKPLGHRNLPMKPVRRAAQAGLRWFRPAPAKPVVRFRRFLQLERGGKNVLIHSLIQDKTRQ